uniref:Beta-microseminoprotein n=1 Tax=Gallus gallus TaxID=9031 RepID=A0A8V0ZGF2_CHICK
MFQPMERRSGHHEFLPHLQITWTSLYNSTESTCRDLLETWSSLEAAHYTMKIFLAFLLAMGIIVTQGDAFCFSKLFKPGEAEKGCMLDGVLYPFGEIPRTENCFRCSCSKNEMHCCSLYHTPVNYDKETCKVIFNKKNCDYEVVQKHPSKPCSGYARVG